ncbi:MAG: hypothetical protein QXL54_03820 [Candidatus Bathyarchaeia archaeon]
MTPMKNQQQTPSFSAYEYAKMASLIVDSMQKIEKVLEKLEKVGDRKNMVLLLQVLDNLSRVHAKITSLGSDKARKQAERAIEKAKKILGEK